MAPRKKTAADELIERLSATIERQSATIELLARRQAPRTDRYIVGTATRVGYEVHHRGTWLSCCRAIELKYGQFNPNTPDIWHESERAEEASARLSVGGPEGP